MMQAGKRIRVTMRQNDEQKPRSSSWILMMEYCRTPLRFSLSARRSPAHVSGLISTAGLLVRVSFPSRVQSGGESRPK